jgi:hypothetical protein
MTIEAKLDRVIELLEQLATALPAAEQEATEIEEPTPAPTPAKGKGKAGKTKPAAAPAVTLDNVRARLKTYLDDHGKGELKALLSRFGLEKLSGADPDQYAGIIALADGGPDAVNGGASDDDDLV